MERTNGGTGFLEMGVEFLGPRNRLVKQNLGQTVCLRISSGQSRTRLNRDNG